MSEDVPFQSSQNHLDQQQSSCGKANFNTGLLTLSRVKQFSLTSSLLCLSSFWCSVQHRLVQSVVLGVKYPYSSNLCSQASLVRPGKEIFNYDYLETCQAQILTFCPERGTQKSPGSQHIFPLSKDCVFSRKLIYLIS